MDSIAARTRGDAIRALIDLFYDDETYVFARQLGNETVIIAFNRAESNRSR